MYIIIISNGKEDKENKKEVEYIEERLEELHLEFMEAFVIKELETVERHIFFIRQYESSLAVHKD